MVCEVFFGGVVANQFQFCGDKCQKLLTGIGGDVNQKTGAGEVYKQPKGGGGNHFVSLILLNKNPSTVICVFFFFFQ